MKLKIHNDGKGRNDSWEATVDGFHVYGFGANEDEAINQLDTLVDQYIESIRDVKRFKKVYVDGCGMPIK